MKLFALNFSLLLLSLLCSFTSHAQEIDKKEQLFYSYSDATKRYAIEDFKGKYVLLDFWGLGCKPCLMAIPELIEIQKKHADKLLIVGVNDQIFLEKLDDYVKKTQINYPIVHAKDFMGVYMYIDVFRRMNFMVFPITYCLALMAM